MVGDPSQFNEPTATTSTATVDQDVPTPEQTREAMRKLASIGGKRSQALKRERGQKAFKRLDGAVKKPSNGASSSSIMPDLATRDGRIEAFHEVVRRFYAGEARPPEAVSALDKLSKLYDDRQALEMERTRPSPAAIAAWVTRLVMHGSTIADSVLDVDALAVALGDAIGRKVTIAGQKVPEEAQDTPPVVVDAAPSVSVPV